MKMKMFPLAIALVCFPALAEETPGQNLLSYFSANCRTQGEWTRAALADSTALIEALKSIASDADCKSVGGAVAQLGLLNQQLSNLKKQTKHKLRLLNSMLRSKSFSFRFQQTLILILWPRLMLTFVTSRFNVLVSSEKIKFLQISRALIKRRCSRVSFRLQTLHFLRLREIKSVLISTRTSSTQLRQLCRPSVQQLQ